MLIPFFLCISDPRHCHPLHPEECPQIHGCPRLALVEAAHQAHSPPQRQQDGRSTQVKDGKEASFSIIFLCRDISLYNDNCAHYIYMLHNFPESPSMNNLLFYCFQEELELLRAKLEKSEKERNEYKLTSERMETRVSGFNFEKCHFQSCIFLFEIRSIQLCSSNLLLLTSKTVSIEYQLTLVLSVRWRCFTGSRKLISSASTQLSL